MGLRTQKRRRREGKTDYKARLVLLKSKEIRIIIRKTNKYVIVQAVESEEAKDRVIKGVISKELLKNGWDEKFSGSLKSIPAAYLTGLLLAKKIDKNKNYILDIGLARSIAGNRIYAAAKGLVDGEVKLKFNEKMAPSKERLNGEHLKPEIKEMIGKIRNKLGGGKQN